MKISKVDTYITLISWLIILMVILLPNQDNVVIQFVRVIFGSIFILFLPWYWLTKSFFSEKEIDFLERFALSFALSISVVPLASFYLNLLWIKITSLSVYLITLFIIVLNIIYLSFVKKNKYVENK